MQVKQAEIVQQSQQSYMLSGIIDFSTTPTLMQQAIGFFKAGQKSAAKKINMDLKQVKNCNSAGLVLMLELVKQASLNEIELTFENLPESLLTIAKAYGVEKEIRDLT